MMSLLSWLIAASLLVYGCMGQDNIILCLAITGLLATASAVALAVARELWILHGLHDM